MRTMATTSRGVQEHLQHHQSHDVHVIKIGGENASDIRTAGWLADFYNKGNKVSVAISALRTKPLNTTNELLKAKEAFLQDWMQSALSILENLYTVHIETLKEAWMYDSELESHLRVLFETYFPDSLIFPKPSWQYAHKNKSLDNLITTNLSFWMRPPTQSVKQTIGAAKEQRFVWYGEVMSAHVLAHLLQTRYGVATTLLTNSIEPESHESNLSGILRKHIWKRVAENIWDSLVIVPGYVGVSGYEFLPHYGRGYTDKMAERIAVWLQDQGMRSTLHIQKQVPLLSSDPRKIQDPQIIPRLSYFSAAEITGARWANAQVLNGYTITHDIARLGVPVSVYNPFDEASPKSIISKNGSETSWVLFVDGRSHVSTVSVSGFWMEWPWLMSKLSEFFTQQQISIDSISSSETEVTFTIYKNLISQEQRNIQILLSEKLGTEYDVEVQNNLWLIYCIGENLAWHPWLIETIWETLKEAWIDIECISQWRQQRAVTIWVSEESLQRAIELLHKKLVI